MKYRFIDLCGVPDAINSRKCNAPREPHTAVAAPVKKTAPPPTASRGSAGQNRPRSSLECPEWLWQPPLKHTPTSPVVIVLPSMNQFKDHQLFYAKKTELPPSVPPMNAAPTASTFQRGRACLALGMGNSLATRKKIAPIATWQCCRPTGFGAKPRNGRSRQATLNPRTNSR